MRIKWLTDRPTDYFDFAYIFQPTPSQISQSIYLHAEFFPYPLPLCILIQCFRKSSISGCNELLSNGALLQNSGPNVPNLDGQMPWIIHEFLCDGITQTLSSFRLIHSMQLVIGHACTNISTSKSFVVRGSRLLISVVLKLNSKNGKFLISHAHSFKTEITMTHSFW